jgi:hypothetical protein
MRFVGINPEDQEAMLPPPVLTSFFSRYSRLRPVRLKSASGGHRRYTALKLFEMPCSTKDFSLFETEVRRDAASAQTSGSKNALTLRDSYKFGIGIEVPSASAVQDGVLNVNPAGGGDPGHTFEYIRDPDGKIVSLMSFGPEGRIRTAADLIAFQKGEIAGKANYPISGSINTWETNISDAQAKLAININASLRSSPPNYTPDIQCTGLALKVAKQIGVNLPSGIGPVVLKDGGMIFNTTLWSGCVTNPYHLNQQMIQAYGPPQVRNASDF